MTDLASSLTAAVRAAPDLYSAPGLAVAAAQTSDPTGSGEALAYGAQGMGVQKAYDEHVQAHGSGPLHAALNFLGAGLHDVEHVVSSGLAASGAPLREVQHQYRYLRDVGERHGLLAALTESLVAGSGATLGALAGGASGAGLGGELAVGAFGRVAWRDSWDRTAAGEQYHDPSSGNLVSPGRDLAHVLHVGEGRWSSGVVDGLFDLAMDPVALAGGMVGQAKAAEGASGLLASRFGGTAINSVEDVDRITSQYGSVRQAFSRMASLPAERISAEFPKFSGLANELGRASTADEVASVFRDAVASDALGRSNMAPMMSFTRRALRGVGDATAGTAVGAITDRVARPFTLVPQTWDPKLLAFSSTHFDPADPQQAAEGLRRVVRMGQSSRVADDVVKRWLEATDIGERADIYSNAVTNMIAARAKIAGFDEVMGPAELQAVKARVDELTKGAGPGGAIYGFMRDGHNASKVLSDGGSEISAAITDNQVGKWAFPNFVAIKRVAQDMQGHASLFGREIAPGKFAGAADDFLYDHFTQGVFKKLVLLSGGFALRMSAAEAIPSALRNGVVNTVKGAVESNVARLGVSADADELGHIGAAVYSLLGRPTRAIGADDVDLATALVQRHNGQIVHPTLSAGEHVSGEVGAKERALRSLTTARKSAPLAVRMGDDFGEFGPQAPEFTDAWHRWLSEVSQDPKTQEAANAYLAAQRAGGTEADHFAAAQRAAKDWLDAQPAEHLSNYDRSRLVSVDGQAMGLTPHEDWARVASENMLSATASHPDLLQAVSEGRLPDRGFLDTIDGVDRPAMVKGRKVTPIMAGTLDRVANLGFKRVLDPIINFLAREPAYFAEVKNQYEPLRKLVEAGTMDMDSALNVAESRAINHMIGHVHNIGERSQMAVTLRNVMPFYFAQTQAYRRVGRLLAEDPGAFRKYQLIFSSLADVGHHENDANGVPHLTLPGTGWLGREVPSVLKKMGIPLVGSVPVAFSGDIKSLATISPFLENEPGTGAGVGPFRAHFGPVVGIAAHALTNFMPESAPLVHAVTGERQAAGSIYDQFIPNQTIKRVVQALGATSSVSFQNAMISTVQTLTARGEAPPADAGPVAQQKFLDRVKNQTRILFLLKAAVGAISPLSPQADIGDVGLQDEFRAAIAKDGIAAGAQEFLAKHPDATPYTVFKSEILTNAPLPASVVAQDFINQHSDLFATHPYAAAWLVPQDDRNFNQGVYNEQLAQSLRVHKAPKQMLDDIYSAAGYQKYNEAVKERDAAIAENPAAETSIRHAFSGYIQNVLGPQNPVWWEQFQSPARAQDRQLALVQLRDVFDSGRAPDTTQARNVAGLLKDYDDYLAGRVNGRADDAAAAQNASLKDSWAAYLARRAAENPSLQGVISKLFEEH